MSIYFEMLRPGLAVCVRGRAAASAAPREGEELVRRGQGHPQTCFPFGDMVVAGAAIWSSAAAPLHSQQPPAPSTGAACSWQR